MKSYQRIFDKPKEKEELTPSFNSNENNVFTQPPKIESGKMTSTKNQLETVILAGISFSGDIKGTHDLFLNGSIDGTVTLNSRLFVGQTGKLKGEVEAESIIIEGEVEGTMTATERIEIRDGGKCIGDVFSPSVMISDKAFFEGRVSMNRVNKAEDEKAEQKNASLTDTDSSISHRSIMKKPTRVRVVDIADDSEDERSETNKEETAAKADAHM